MTKVFTVLALSFVNPASTECCKMMEATVRHQMRYYLASLYLCKTNGLHQLSEARNQIRGLRLKTNFSRSTLHLQDS